MSDAFLEEEDDEERLDTLSTNWGPVYKQLAKDSLLSTKYPNMAISNERKEQFINMPADGVENLIVYITYYLCSHQNHKARMNYVSMQAITGFGESVNTMELQKIARRPSSSFPPMHGSLTGLLHTQRSTVALARFATACMVQMFPPIVNVSVLVNTPDKLKNIPTVIEFVNGKFDCDVDVYDLIAIV